MKNIVILGNTSICVRLIEEIRQTGTESQISLFCFEGIMPYFQNDFPQLLSTEKKMEEAFVQAESFYQNNGVRLITEGKISRINYRKRIIFLEDKTQLPFDILIVTQASDYKFPSLKGTNKTGVFHIERLTEINAIVKELPLIDTVIIQSDSLRGLQTANILSKRINEVIYVTNQTDPISEHRDSDLGQELTEAVDSKKIQILSESRISEILGDSDTKAVKLESGKVIGCQMVIFDQVNKDLRLFADIGINQGIVVDRDFRSSMEGIYALGPVCAHPDEGPNRLGFHFEQVFEDHCKHLAGIITDRVPSDESTDALEEVSG